MSESEAAKSAGTKLEGVTPILRVHDLQSSIDYYANVLGFKLDWHVPGIIGSVSRDGCAIMLCEGDQGNPGSWVWIGAEDVEPLFEEYRARGAKIRRPPTNYSWAYELQVEDPDGNVLRFGSEPLSERPFGEWLDAHGTRWRKTPAGAWTRVEHD